MCGIVAATVRQGGVLETLLAGLRSLEYRGYDSAGIALGLPGLPTRKAQGRIDNLVARIEASPLPDGPTGIAHTRWATHGAPSDRNAHPHASGPLVAVHNGILENHEAIRRELSQGDGGGRCYRSETDSEVWVAMLEQELAVHHGEPSAEAVVAALRRAMGRARGSYALAVLHEALPGRIFFARHESPLVIGLGEEGNYVASDIAALLDSTHRFLYLEDGMLGWISPAECRVFDRELQPCDPPVDVVSWNAEAVEKQGYAHFMLKEIEEQPAVVARTLQSVTSAGGRILPDFEIEDLELAKFRRVVILACGTALHAARIGKYVIEECAGVPVDVDFASEFRYRNPMIDHGDLALAISQSGETADTLGALKVAAERGATPIAICNVRGSSLSRLASATILTQCGPEIGVASTKAFTAQLLAIHLLALRLGMARRVLDEAELMRRLEVLRQARPLMERLVSREARDQVRRLARRYARKPIFFFLGRGADYPIALEGALKLKEISYVHAEGYPAGEMKHGPLALVSDEMVCVAIAGRGSVYDKVVANMQEVKTRGGIVVAVAHAEQTEAIEAADDVILVPEADPSIAPMLHVVPLQYFAYFVALERGCDIDKPRNLAKSVTVE